MTRRARKLAPRVFTLRPPFSATIDGSSVLDALGYYVVQFGGTTRIGGEDAARVVADALNEHLSSPHLEAWPKNRNPEAQEAPAVATAKA